jgi:hypothetical protein
LSGGLLRPDLSPLRSRGFRAVFVSRTVVMFGSQAAEVALLVQAKQLTGSPPVVGLLSMLAITPGPWLVYALDAAGFAVSFWMLGGLPALPPVSAATWSAGIAAFGLAPDIWVALAFLVIAGAADESSGIFRDILWKQMIPDHLRGRMAGVELLAYGGGPPVGQLRSGVMASAFSLRFSASARAAEVGQARSIRTRGPGLTYPAQAGGSASPRTQQGAGNDREAVFGPGEAHRGVRREDTESEVDR